MVKVIVWARARGIAARSSSAGISMRNAFR
jgi:hypothetical protein